MSAKLSSGVKDYGLRRQVAATAFFKQCRICPGAPRYAQSGVAFSFRYIRDTSCVAQTSRRWRRWILKARLAFHREVAP